MDRNEYIDKTTNLLSHPAYRTIERDPTNKPKAKIITLFMKLQGKIGTEDYIYKYMSSKRCTSPKFYGLPKIHKTNIPLRPIVFCRGEVTYGVANVLVKILEFLVWKSTCHIHSTKHFVERVSRVILQPGECLCSYDVTALFISVPVDPALNIIQGLPWAGHFLAK